MTRKDSTMIAIEISKPGGPEVMLPAERPIPQPRPGEWRHLSVPLSCFTSAGADLSAVVAPFAVESSGRLEMTIADVSLAQGTEARGRPCP